MLRLVQLERARDSKEIVMNIKALVTMFVLGSSSVAMAHPVSYTGVEGAPIVARDHRTTFVPQWTTLGTATQVTSGAMQFRVSPSLGKFSTLRLQTESGKSLINRVEIKFANGATQVVALNRYLTAANPRITIDLDGDWARSIRKVTVIGRNARQSSFDVLAI
jgi:hypothetical protein